MKARHLVFVLVFVSVAALVPPALARVVRPAPDFAWVDGDGKTRTLKSLQGQSVILLIAASPRERAFRAQIGQLQKDYQRFAAAKLVCIAAFTQQGGTIRSNIPFLQAADGPRVAYLYGIERGFATALIGPDGNLDYVRNRVLPAQRIYDLMGASFAVQERLRRP